MSYTPKTSLFDSLLETIGLKTREEVEITISSWECDVCDDTFDTERGRNIHSGRVH